jgi:hypothetical protein
MPYREGLERRSAKILPSNRCRKSVNSTVFQMYKSGTGLLKVMRKVTAIQKNFDGLPLLTNFFVHETRLF